MYKFIIPIILIILVLLVLAKNIVIVNSPVPTSWNGWAPSKQSGGWAST